MNKVTQNTTQNRELQILTDAIDAFKSETGLQIDLLKNVQLKKDHFGDAMVQIGGANYGFEYNVEIKGQMNDVIVGRLANILHDETGNNILVTRFVPPNLAKKMKALNIQFIDTAGNAFINNPPMLLYVSGNRNVQAEKREGEQDIFGIGGIRVLFVLLCQPELENGTYRDIAAAARVALGTVAGVMKNLLQQGYLMDYKGRKIILLRKKELLDKWVAAYAAKLRPKKIIGRFTAPREYLWRDVEIRNHNAQWGGEVAANKLTNYLKPEILTIYTRKPIEKLVISLKLRKDEKGLIEVREQFWKFDTHTITEDTVPPLLVYADLLATGDNRNIETAKIIYDEHLKRYFE